MVRNHCPATFLKYLGNFQFYISVPWLFKKWTNLEFLNKIFHLHLKKAENSKLELLEQKFEDLIRTVRYSDSYYSFSIFYVHTDSFASFKITVLMTHKSDSFWPFLTHLIPFLFCSHWIIHIIQDHDQPISPKTR